MQSKGAVDYTFAQGSPSIVEDSPAQVGGSSSIGGQASGIGNAAGWLFAGAGFVVGTVQAGNAMNIQKMKVTSQNFAGLNKAQGSVNNINTSQNYLINGSGANQGGNSSFNTREYTALVVSESGNNFFEAAAIGSVLNNRMKHKGTSLSQGDWLNKISGKSIHSTYNGYLSKIYTDILSMTDDQFNAAAASDAGYGPRIRGALLALPGLFDYSSGSYFWNATSQQYDDNIGPNWRGINNGTYMINTQIGGTTFFKYTNPFKTWP